MLEGRFYLKSVVEVFPEGSSKPTVRNTHEEWEVSGEDVLSAEQAGLDLLTARITARKAK